MGAVGPTPQWISFVWLGALLLTGCGANPGGLQRTTEGVGARPDFTPKGELAIYAIDVGNGDATLILGPEDGRGERLSLLIDAGKLRADGGRIVGAVLEGAGVGQLDYVVATHYDADHIGGFVGVLGSRSVLWADEDCTPGPHAPRQAIIDLGDWPATSATIEQYLRCVEATADRGVEHVVVRDGDHLGRSFELGGGYLATLVAGGGYVMDHEARQPYVNTPNEHSIAVWVHGPGGFDLLVTGDLIGRRLGSENALLEPVLGAALKARGVDLEVLRLGHHGADNATSPELLASLQPEVALISVSAQNSFGHPGCGTYQALADLPIQRVVQTQAGATTCPGDLVTPQVADGTIAVFVTGGRYEVTSAGPFSGATGRETQPFSFVCTVQGGCVDQGAPPQVPGPGDLIFTEVMSNPVARPDSRGEWFELTARGATTYDLGGCTLRDDDRDQVVLGEGLMVPAGGVVTLANSPDPGFVPTSVYQGLTLANTADELELVCAGVLIDRVTWDRGFALTPGASLSLDPEQGDADTNDDPASWCPGETNYATDRGTPNRRNTACP